MPYKEVWVDEPDLDEWDDDDLIDELTSRGFSVYGKGHRPNVSVLDIQSLYNTYNTMSPEFFDKELKKFFREHLGVLP
jgi:hypothetical protein